MPTILNNRSTLATDPIRNFRFLVIFKPHTPSSSTSSSSSGSATTAASAAGSTTAVDTAAASAISNLASIPFGFTSVSGLATTTDAIPYREGSYNTTVHQIPGQTSFAPITMQRGMMINTAHNWNWMKTLFQTVQSSVTRSNAVDFRCDVEIQVLAHPVASGVVGPTSGTGGATTVPQEQDDFVIQRFYVYNAWITAISYSDLNAGDNAIFVEQISLVHEGFDMAVAESLTSAAAKLN